MLGAHNPRSALERAAQALPEYMLPGQAEPLGATARDTGVNFAVFSEHAQRVWVCVFDGQGQQELRRYALHGPRDGVWHGFLPGCGPGLVYGLRADGPYAPHEGHRFNPNKLLLDPWARDIVGSFEWRDEHHGYTVGHPDGPRSFDDRDNAPWALKARVGSAPTAAPGWHNAPRHDRADVVLYEVHVKSFSQRHPGIPSELQGTYAALAHPAAIEHFVRLGVTTLSLLPVHYRLSEAFLAPLGLVNHWGYNTLGFFCPDPRLARRDPAAPGAQREFQDMVHTLHAHGLEVVLDVVYNHTAEGNEWGPTLSFRGLDHRSWYRLDAQDPSACVNFSGCGNTLNITHPRVLQWVMDSLRYWVWEMGVDGFRFDLAAVLGRTHPHFDSRSHFFAALAQDPVLSRARWIAESWDSGPQGYQVGRFPLGWLEWNDRFRDAVRRYWLWPTHAVPPQDSDHSGASSAPSRIEQAGPISRGEFARRFCASSDLFHHSGRHPTASVNFISAHDGFTLADFTQYRHKHNHANGENNRDGRDDELSTEVGDPAVRQRVRRAILATLALAQGTPMVLSGDEMGHSQGGNNNAWSQDSEVSWLNWSTLDSGMRDLLADALALRRREPALRHDRWFGHAPQTQADHALSWITPEGLVMDRACWEDLSQSAFACHIRTGRGDDAQDRPGAGDGGRGSQALLLAFNPHAQPVDFALPAFSAGAFAGTASWRVALDTSGTWRRDTRVANVCTVPAHSLLVLSF